jgi:amino acid adenylation domain-containing protein/non-ribosomal peptide synthase protein (TIGR01720 family)
MPSSQEIIQGYRLSPQQKRLWQLQQADQEQSYLVRCQLELDGDLDEAALQQALEFAVGQHEILRTTFQLLPGMTIPVQVISDQVIVAPRKIDLSDLSPDEQTARLEAIFTETTAQADYTQLPLLQAGLIRLSERRHFLQLSAPPLCADLTSLQALSRQIAAAYGAAKSGSELSAIEAMQYADFAEWKNELLESPEAVTALQHWNQIDSSEARGQRLSFEKSPAPTNVSRVSDPRASSIALDISIPLACKLKQLADKCEVTLATVLLACWQTLLLRSTGAESIHVGVAFEGRNFPELKEAIGPMESYLPISSQLSEDLAFSSLLRQLDEQQQAAGRVQQFFAPELLAQPERNRAEPLFPFCFAWQAQPEVIQVAGLSISCARQEMYSEPFKLKLVCQTSTEGAITARLFFNPRLFAAGDVERLCQRLRSLIVDVAGGDDKLIADLDVLGKAERRSLLVDFNATQKDFPGAQLIHELFAAQAEQRTHSVAVIYEDDQLTFAELNGRANQLAHRLQRLGVGPDSAVGLCLERSIDLVVGLLGILKAGGAYVPLDPGLPVDRLNGMLADVNANVLVTRKNLVEGLGPFVNHIVDVETTHLETAGNNVHSEWTGNPDARVTEQNLAYIIFTSGSTGRPKGVAVEHRQLANYVNAVCEELKLPEESSFATVSTIAADLGNTVLFPPLLRGGTLHLISEECATKPDAFVEYCRRHPIDCLKIVPSHLTALLSAASPAELLPRRRLVLGGEACAWTLLERIASLAPACELLNHYGPTETTVGATTYDIKFSERDPLSETVPLGHPLSNAQVYVLDKGMRPAPIGVPGELHIGGAGVARGYVGRPDATAEKFIPHPYSSRPGERLYRTGDLARIQPDGKIEFLGRIDDQVKIHGFRIEPAEITEVLRLFPRVREAVVVAREDQPGEKRLVAYVVLRDQVESDAGELKVFLQGKLPDYMIPKGIVLLDALPLTRNGKIDRHALPAPELLRSGAQQLVAPRNQIEETLVTIWSGVLGVQEMGIHDNFFELGGDSILSIQIIARANQAGLKLSPRQVFQHQTIAELAAVAGTVETVVAEQGLVTGPVPLTPVQARFFAQEQTEPHHYNQAMLLNLQETLEPDVLEQALARLVAHHDALRLRFEKRTEGWRQVMTGLDDGPSTVSVEQFELSELSAQSARLQASLNLESGPLLRAALFKSSDGHPGKLLIVVHHLVIDGVSWRVLLEDLQTLYSEIKRGKVSALPAKTTSFKSWSERLSTHAKSAELLAEAPFWLGATSPAVTRLPVDFEDGGNTSASAATVTVALDPRETLVLLMEAPAAYRTQINEVLVTALAQTLSQWTKSRALLLDLEGHGREEIFTDVDLTRTVGWFTTIFPVSVELEESAGVITSLRQVKDQLRAIPNRGIGYGLLRYLSGNAEISGALENQPQAQVRFNYLGQTDRALRNDALFTPAAEASGPAQSLGAARGYLLNIIGAVTEGALRLEWTYSQNIHRRETIEWLAETYLKELRTLIENSRSRDAESLSPTDFPRANLSQKDLDKVLSRLRRT